MQIQMAMALVISMGFAQDFLILKNLVLIAFGLILGSNHHKKIMDMTLLITWM